MPSPFRSLADRATNVAAFLVVLAANYLANALPLGGRTTGAISDAYPSLFTPAGYTFAIWGLIYLLLAGFVIRQTMESRQATLGRIDWPFRINCVANALWIVAWHFDFLILSFGIMLVILGSLIQIVRVLRSDADVQKGWSFLLIALPFSVYLGWISVATIANMSVLQSAWGLNDVLIGETAWTFLKLAVAAACAVLIGWRHRDAPYALVIAWAAVGIAVARAEQPGLQSAALVVAGLSLAAGIAAIYKPTRPAPDA